LELPQVATVSHEEVLAVGKQRGEVMRDLVGKIVDLIIERDGGIV
jgi:hypothetical protein